MFRNPRGNAKASTQDCIKPSTGRPPTPPSDFQHLSDNLLRSKAAPKSQRDQIIPISSAGKRAKSKSLIPARTSRKPNASILSFFKKVESPLKDESIFLHSGNKPWPKPQIQNTAYEEFEFEEDLRPERFNEIARPVKRQRISQEFIFNDDSTTLEPSLALPHIDEKDLNLSAINSKETKPRVKAKPHRIGPFLEDSDSDNENYTTIPSMSMSSDQNMDIASKKLNKIEPSSETDSTLDKSNSLKFEQLDGKPLDFLSKNHEITHNPPEESIDRQKMLPGHLTKHKFDGNSTVLSLHEKEPMQIISSETKRLSNASVNFDESNLSDDDNVYGEESVNKKWIEEQIELEAGDSDTEDNKCFDKFSVQQQNQSSNRCPVCNADFCGISTDLASRHVNDCLDGNFVKLPVQTQAKVLDGNIINTNNKLTLANKAAIPRPGQKNPFEIEKSDSRISSAFTELMSGKAEDAAWTSAAASERSSKGKSAYQRTCPFYKIIPGFSICVDAFRYGAVQGCYAYFLSHFHSDHYIGLSSSWCHGPIYCSKVTANLVKQQLRVDPKYVIALEFDKTFEIPNTPNVSVTMIHANHCPGSSLFLYEKVNEKYSTRSQRILHCGDFRACPAHISHPLLMPDIVDSITKKNTKQKIDVCYLDTTYLNPRYAFPPQEQVIQACADLCLSLKKESIMQRDTGKDINRNYAETSISKYLESPTQKVSDGNIVTSPTSTKNRGRLLIVCGTYSIGKERICLGIARALNCKIYAPARKMRICAALEDEELMSRMTNDPREAQIHLQMLMEIRAETLQEYLNSYRPHFTRIVGFRPSGWTYKPPSSRGTQTATIPQILTSSSWRSTFSLSDLIPQRGSNREASCYGVPYSEHSSFRELTLFVCALRIEKVIPTVNVGSASGRAKMKVWIDRWLAEQRKNGPIKIGEGIDEVSWY